MVNTKNEGTLNSQSKTPKSDTAKTVQNTETPSKPLSAEEQALLKKHETTIKAGLQTFHEVGMAFADIRDRGLYREHGTFDQYCEKVWKVSRSKAYHYMAAAKCLENLNCIQMATNVPLAIPKTESQARKLAKVTPAQQVEVAKRVAKKTNEPTAKDFEDEVEALEEKPRVKTYDISAEVQTKTTNNSKATEAGVMTLADFYQLITDTYDAYNQSLDGKVGAGLKKLKSEAKKLMDWEAREAV